MAEASLKGITLQVTDVERSVEFYRRIPGVQVVSREPGQAAVLRFGHGLLKLRRGSGEVQLIFETDDVDGIREALGAHRDPDDVGFEFLPPGSAGNEPSELYAGVPFNPQMRDEDAGLG